MEKLKVKEVEKEWGKEIWMVNSDLYCGKILLLDKGKRCSLHYHKDKDEVFYFHSGKVLFEYGPENELIEEIMYPGNSVRVFPGDLHRFGGLEDSIILEMSTHHEDFDSYRIPGELSGDIPKEIKIKYGLIN